MENGRLKSPASRLIAEPYAQAHIKQNIKAHWSLWRESTGYRCVPLKKSQ